MKKLNLLFTALLLMCCVGTAKAEEVTINGIKYDVITDTKQATVISGDTKYSGDIVIPSEITYNNVTCNVISIGEQAFRECYGLTSITIPNSVTSIGERAFSGCNGLESIVVEKGNTKYDSRDNCNAIIETENNTLIAGCKKTIIPNSVTSIGEDAFYSCSGLTSVIIGNSVTSIGSGAFHNCSALTSITIPNSVTSIGNWAFRECSGLTSVTIPNSVTSIGSDAFSGCSGLTSITIPNSVTSIGSSAFVYCSGLESIVVEESNTKYDSRNNCNAIIEKESNTLITGCKNSVIPNSVTSIGYDAFGGCDGLTSITIPNSVTSIGESAFLDCSGLTSITIPNSVTSIGDYAFGWCSGLTSITIPNSITSIGSSAFYDCDGLTSITIPNSVTSIGNEAFANCSGLTSVIIGNSVTSIGEDAFYNCENLADVYCFATNVPSTDSYAFYNSYPENVTLHVPVASINNYKTTAPWSSFGNIVEIANTDIIKIPAKAVLVTSNNGTINICCSLEGENVAVYTSDAMYIGSTTIENGCATIRSGLSKGNIAIIKIAEKSIKVIID